MPLLLLNRRRHESSSPFYRVATLCFFWTITALLAAEHLGLACRLALLRFSLRNYLQTRRRLYSPLLLPLEAIPAAIESSWTGRFYF